MIRVLWNCINNHNWFDPANLSKLVSLSLCHLIVFLDDIPIYLGQDFPNPPYFFYNSKNNPSQCIKLNRKKTKQDLIDILK